LFTFVHVTRQAEICHRRPWKIQKHVSARQIAVHHILACQIGHTARNVHHKVNELLGSDGGQSTFSIGARHAEIIPKAAVLHKLDEDMHGLSLRTGRK
jgi:hypothetical protein